MNAPATISLSQNQWSEHNHTAAWCVTSSSVVVGCVVVFFFTLSSVSIGKGKPGGTPASNTEAFQDPDSERGSEEERGKIIVTPSNRQYARQLRLELSTRLFSPGPRL